MSDNLEEGPEGRSNSDRSLDSDMLGDLSTDASQVVSARGTEDGLVLRIDGRNEWQQIIDDLDVFLGKKQKFFEGGEVSIEWLDRLPTKEQSEQLEVMLKDNYGIQVKPRPKKKPPLKKIRRTVTKEEGEGPSGVTISLFEEEEVAYSSPSIPLNEQIDTIISSPPKSGNSLSSTFPPEAMLSIDEDDTSSSDLNRNYLSRMTRALGEDPFFDDDANAKVVFGTLRSGQRVETPFSLVVIGDVNPGADLVAGGDIIVVGNLRGTAHAGAYDDESYDRVIVSLKMQPMQLRIGSVISRGSDEDVSGTEVARIDNRRIIVEAFNSRKQLKQRNRS